MFDSLVECLVQRKLTNKALAGRCAIVLADGIVAFLGVIVLMLSNFLAVIVFLVFILMGVLTWLVFRNTNVEYEYGYFEGELSIDKIMNRSTRKKISTFDFGKMDFMAPSDSNRFHVAKNRTRYDYSVCDDSIKSYTAVLYDSKNNACELKFTPNEELIAAIKKAYPRKVYED